jgi:predicted SAM-dependent methyltransferase
MSNRTINNWIQSLRFRLALRRRIIYQIKKRKSLSKRSQIINEYLKDSKVKGMQVGAGLNPLPGWLNTDIEVEEGLIYVDATRPLPLPDACMDYVFSEHMFEHIGYPQGAGFLREANRILKSGGKVRIATPDLAFLIKLYGDGESDLIKRYIKIEVDTYIDSPKAYTRGNVINNCFYNWGHRFIYDIEMLSLTLEDAGFVDIKRVQPKQSDDPHLRNLESHWKIIGDEFNNFETIVVEARKP